jgi:dephospho-CoA kinase
MVLLRGFRCVKSVLLFFRLSGVITIMDCQAGEDQQMVLGVTGGIASGKSFVADLFRRLGAIVISADELAREVVRPGGKVLERLVEHFGRSILAGDGTLDRDALGKKIFADEKQRRALNALIHPAIASLAEQRLAEARRAAPPLIVYEAPLLFEAGAQDRVDAVLVVKVDPQVQLERLMARDGIDEGSARRKIAAQMSQAEKLARADFIIDNSEDRDQTRLQAEQLFERLAGRNKNAP